MKTKFMSVSMSLLIAGFTLCACTEGLGGVGDNPITPETPTTPDEPETPETPTEIKGILSEISVESEGNNGVLAFTYGDDGKPVGAGQIVKITINGKTVRKEEYVCENVDLTD